MQTQKSIVHYVWNWLDSRYRLTLLMASLTRVDIPRAARTYYLGGLTLFFFIIQGVTGILLALYYEPTSDTAYDSILFIMHRVHFGWLIRSVHSWGANLMVIFWVLHLLRIFFQGVYKAPHEITWGAGVFLLLLTLGFCFTGSLLPWDQRAYWGTTIDSDIVGAAPVIGESLLTFLRGGVDITGRTLGRFFGVHVLVLPVALVGMLIVHITLLYRRGLADPSLPANVSPTSESNQKKKKLIPFFPNYVLDEIIVWYILLAIIIALASLFPAGLGEPADPLHTLADGKPEWYFVFFCQALKYMPRIGGTLLPLFGISLLLLLPFIDRNPQRAPRKRPIAIVSGVLTLIIIVILSVWGWYS